MNCTVDELIPIADVARRLRSARPGRKVHLSTLLRWITTGCHGRKLQAWRIGRAWYTSEAALAAFFQPSTGDEPDATVDDHRHLEKQAALRRCDALGIR